jgi:hypothetical protein
VLTNKVLLALITKELGNPKNMKAFLNEHSTDALLGFSFSGETSHAVKQLETLLLSLKNISKATPNIDPMKKKVSKIIKNNDQNIILIANETIYRLNLIIIFH